MKYSVVIICCILFSNFISGQKLLKNLKKSHDGEILCVDISKDGSKILTGGSDNRTYMWGVKSGDKLKSIGTHTDRVNGVAFSSNDKLFVTASADKRMIVWNTETGKPVGILKGHENPVLCAAYNPVTDFLASGSEGGNIRLWDEKNKFVMLLSGHSKKVNDIQFSPDGKYLASGSEDNTIRIWNAESYQEEKVIEAGYKIQAVAYSSDGMFVAGAGQDGKVSIWNAKTGAKLSSFEGLKSKVNTVVFTPDVQYIAAAGLDNQIFIWELELGQLVKNIEAHSKGINEIKFSDRENVLVSVGSEADINIWDVKALNIGKKKAATDSGDPELVCSALRIDEKNENGILEFVDYANLEFSVTNKGEGIAYDVTARISVDKDIEGLITDPEVFIGNLTPGKDQKVVVPITVSPDVPTDNASFTVKIEEANGHNPEPVTLAFQTKGSNNVFILVGDYKYESATGKAEVGSPITMKLFLKNATNTDARNIKITYRFPENVVAVDKLFENIDLFKPNELKEVSVQFMANDKYAGEDIKVGIDITGAAYTNLADINFAIAMNQELPVNKDVYISESESGSEIIYRGGGDPLKGLNVSAAKRELQFGKYYALIIGIDEYKGEWAKLQNAVQDAKAVEQLLKEKYRFDHFKSLYNGDATRESIIQEMEWLVANVESNDNVFIYYSGHGDFKQSLNKGYWVPADATTTTSTSKYISNSDIQTFLGGIASKHTLLISDACFSGDIFRGKTVSVPFENSEKYYQKVNGLASRQAISSGGIEPVMDGGRDGHSVFAYYLLKSLANNTYKYFDASQLFEKIRVPVVNNSEQSPNFSPIKNTGDEGGQFIFIKK